MTYYCFRWFHIIFSGLTECVYCLPSLMEKTVNIEVLSSTEPSKVNARRLVYMTPDEPNEI